ncbi:phosphatase PAP2 family protein [Ferruginibacter sp.]
MNLKKIYCCFLLLVAVRSNAQNLDINLLKAANPSDPHNNYWKGMSGSAYFVSAAVPVFILSEGIIKNDVSLRQKARNIFGSIFIELVVSESMKSAINRKRPAETYPGVIFPYHEVTGRSFPSGHTSLVFATAASLSIQYKKWYVVVPAYAWATSVGYSRMYLGVHYPSDVLGGAAVGIGSAYLSQWLNKKLFPAKKTVQQRTSF